MTPVNIRLPEQLNSQLMDFAKRMDLPKSHLIRLAIKDYLTELQDDFEDIAAAEEVLANSTGETISLEEFETKYGLAD